MALLVASGDVSAQAADPVDRLLATVLDETKDRAVRAQAISSLLACGEERGHDELAKLLASTETAEDLRLLIASGSLLSAGLPLLDPVIDVAVGGDELGARVREFFGDAPSGELTEALGQRIDDPGTAPERRLVLIGLLGHTGRRAALDRLVGLWESEDAAVSGEAAAAFQRILPSHFDGPAAARKFLAANPKLDVVELLQRYAAHNGDTQPDPALPALVELVRKVAGDIGYQRLLEDYLANELSEVRKIGAEALAKYPWDEREAAGAPEARAKAAGVVLEVLDTEPDDDVVMALLLAARSISEALLIADPGRTNHVVTKGLASGNRAVRLAAIETLGKLGDPGAIEALQKQFAGAGEADADYRLAVLDALLLIRTKQSLGNGGLSDWFVEKLKGGEKLDEVVLRLIEILGGYKKLEKAVEPLAEYLRTSENGTIRRKAANCLGLLGVPYGNAAALTALSEAVVGDKDVSVREVAATGLSRAPREAVTPDVIERLTTRLGEAEKEIRVRRAAARSLLGLRGAEALPSLLPLVGDDRIWQQAVLVWLNSEVLAAPAPADAAALVRALRGAAAWERCVDAAGRILAATSLVWEGPAAAHRRAVVLDRAWATAETAGPAEALALLPSAEIPAEAVDRDTFDLIYLRARLLRLTGKAAAAVPALEALLAKVPPIEGAPVRDVRLELGECRLAGQEWDAAVAAIQPLLGDPNYGERARRIDERASSGREIAKLIDVLDSADAAVRQAAVDGLKGMGESAWPALDRWLTSREGAPATAAAAVKVLGEILAKPLAYDPAAPEEARSKSLAEAHAALKPGA
ncbi:MAG: HEAT repeat domain-containing protein [Planctomycetota bacterium]